MKSAKWTEAQSPLGLGLGQTGHMEIAGGSTGRPTGLSYHTTHLGMSLDGAEDDANDPWGVGPSNRGGDNINSFGNGDTSDQFNAAGDPFKAAGDGEARRGGGRRVYVEATSREIDRSNVPDLGADTAWLAIEKAGNERDLDDFREALKSYSKALPDTTFEQLERSFRHFNFKIYIIALEKEMTETYTLMNLQGRLGCKFQVGYFFSPDPQRASQKEAWPANVQDNLERLKDAGVPVDKGVPLCNNCNELGHKTRECPEEKVERERLEIKCANCDGIGHRARDCTSERKDRFACRNCKQPGHTAAECTEPRSAEGVECKHCNEMGHFARDCPTKPARTCRNCGAEDHMAKECDKPRNPETVTCRNCDQMGHFSKECPLPRDYSRVKCQNCNEMGHTKVRCKNPPAEEGATGFGDQGGFDQGGFGISANDVAPAGDWKHTSGVVESIETYNTGETEETVNW